MYNGHFSSSLDSVFPSILLHLGMEVSRGCQHKRTIAQGRWQWVGAWHSFNFYKIKILYFPTLSPSFAHHLKGRKTQICKSRWDLPTRGCLYLLIRFLAHLLESIPLTIMHDHELFLGTVDSSTKKQVCVFMHVCGCRDGQRWPWASYSIALHPFLLSSDRVFHLELTKFGQTDPRYPLAFLASPGIIGQSSQNWPF